MIPRRSTSSGPLRREQWAEAIARSCGHSILSTAMTLDEWARAI